MLGWDQQAVKQICMQAALEQVMSDCVAAVQAAVEVNSLAAGPHSLLGPVVAIRNTL